jgi:Glycosyl transferase family 2
MALRSERLQSSVSEAESSAPAHLKMSIIIECFTPGEHAHRGLAVPDPGATLDALLEQVSEWNVEIIAIIGPTTTDALSAQLAAREDVRVVLSTSSTYFSQKNDAVRQTNSPIVAFFDGDCMPGPNWASAVFRALEGGADAVTGPIKYARGPMSRTMSFFDFGSVVEGTDGMATNLFSSNVAFRRETILSYPYDERIKRSGGSFFLARRLKAGGRWLAFSSEMTSVHAAQYRKGGWFKHRMRNGHDAMNIRKFDDSGVLPYQWLPRLGILGAPLIMIGRVKNDVVRTIVSREDLGLDWKIVPWLWLASIPVRLLEGASFAISCVRPDAVARRWG